MNARSALALPLVVLLTSSVGWSRQSTTRVSVDSAGVQANLWSRSPVMSGDGRYVAFESFATNLIAADTNGALDVFVRDRLNNTTLRVSVDSAGVQANADSAEPFISADGRYVAFGSSALNLVPGDTNFLYDVFVHDRLTATTSRVSIDSAGGEADSDSSEPSISADGRFVAFRSQATNLVAGDTNATKDVFVHDRLISTTSRVSVDSAGLQGNGYSQGPVISADGRCVAFWSIASNLVTGDTNGCTDVFVHDRLTATMSRVSLDTAGVQGNGYSFEPSISADGRFVAFHSAAFNLVPNDANGMIDVFVYDRMASVTSRSSVSTAGVQSNGHSYNPSISADGRYVSFWSFASNLVPNDTNGATDEFAHDRTAFTTARTSCDSAGVQGDGDSHEPSISADGRYVTFTSAAANLVAGDTNQREDEFVNDRAHRCYADADVDGYGDPQAVILSVPACGAGYVTNALDCDDGNAAIHPGATDLCNNTDDDCNGVIDDNFTYAYCTAGTTVHGCVPSIASVGVSSSSASSGFDVVVQQVEGQRYGVIFYGFYPLATSWAPGSTSFKCIASPVARTGVTDSGGTAGQCNGELRLDFNAWLQANPGGLGNPFVAGQVFYAQGWFRDPAAPKGTNLSDGLRFVLCQ